MYIIIIITDLRLALVSWIKILPSFFGRLCHIFPSGLYSYISFRIRYQSLFTFL